MTRVIVHAGYHKTGTTSLQDFLSKNKELLNPYLQYYGKGAFQNAGAMARIYAQRPFPWRLKKFRKTFRNFLVGIPQGGTIFLSRETFSGGMPGHRRFGGALMTSYFRPALKLAQVIIAELRRRFGKNVDITFFYTTREHESWIRSIHGHLLRSIKMTDDFDTFRARFPTLTGPAEEAQKMRVALAPIPVATAALEKYGTRPEGPAAAVLELLNIDEKTRAQLTPAARENIGQNNDLRAEFLLLNRQGINRSDTKAAKMRLISKDHNNA